MAKRGQRQSGARRSVQRNRRRVSDADNEGIIPVLARAVREVEAAVERGHAKPAVRTKFQVVALLVREERARVMADDVDSETHRAGQLKRLDGIATILAKTAARDTSLLELLAEDAVVSDAAKSLKRDMQIEAGIEPAPEHRDARGAGGRRGHARGRAAVGHRPPAGEPVPRPRLLGRGAGQGPPASPGRLGAARTRCFRSFERGRDGAPACMPLPDRRARCWRRAAWS